MARSTPTNLRHEPTFWAPEVLSWSEFVGLGTLLPGSLMAGGDILVVVLLLGRLSGVSLGVAFDDVLGGGGLSTIRSPHSALPNSSRPQASPGGQQWLYGSPHVTREEEVQPVGSPERGSANLDRDMVTSNDSMHTDLCMWLPQDSILECLLSSYTGILSGNIRRHCVSVLKFIYIFRTRRTYQQLPRQHPPVSHAVCPIPQLCLSTRSGESRRGDHSRSVGGIWAVRRLRECATGRNGA